MHTYHNVAELRQFLGGQMRVSWSFKLFRTALRYLGPLGAASVNLNIQIPNFLSERVAVQTQQIGSSDLVATGRRQRGR